MRGGEDDDVDFDGILTSRKPSSAREEEFSRQRAFFNKSWLEKEEIESVGLMGLNLNLFTSAERKTLGGAKGSAVSTAGAIDKGDKITFRPAAGGNSAMSKMVLKHWLRPWEESNGGSRFSISEGLSVYRKEILDIQILNKDLS